MHVRVEIWCGRLSFDRVVRCALRLDNAIIVLFISCRLAT